MKSLLCELGYDASQIQKGQIVLLVSKKRGVEVCGFVRHFVEKKEIFDISMFEYIPDANWLQNLFWNRWMDGEYLGGPNAILELQEFDEFHLLKHSTRKSSQSSQYEIMCNFGQKFEPKQNSFLKPGDLIILTTQEGRGKVCGFFDSYYNEKIRLAMNKYQQFPRFTFTLDYLLNPPTISRKSYRIGSFNKGEILK